MLMRLSASGDADGKLPAPSPELSRAKLGAALCFRAGDELSAVVLLGARHQLLHAGRACAGMLRPAAGQPEHRTARRKRATAGWRRRSDRNTESTAKHRFPILPGDAARLGQLPSPA